MKQREACRSVIRESLTLLEKLSIEIKNSAMLKDHIMTLEFGLQYLDRFLHYSNVDLQKLIKDEVYTVREKLLSLPERPDDTNHLDLVTAFIVSCAEMQNIFIKPDIQYYFVTLPEISVWHFKAKKINGFLVEEIGSLFRSKANLVAHLMKEIEDIKEKLILLQPLFTFIAKERVKCKGGTQKHLSPLFALHDRVSSLLYTCLVDKIDEEMSLAMKRNFSDLLEKINVKETYIMFLKALKALKSTDDPNAIDSAQESGYSLLDNLIKLVEANVNAASPLVSCCIQSDGSSRQPHSSQTYVNGPGEELHDKLKFLKNFLADLPYELKLEKSYYHQTSIESITWKAVSVLRPSFDNNMKEDMAAEVNHARFEVYHQIEDIQADVEWIKPYNFPKVDGLGFLDHFLGHLEDLQKCWPKLIEILKNQIETLHLDFDFLRSFLKKIEEQHNEHQELGDIWTRIIGLAYQAEHVVDFYLVKDAPGSRIVLSLTKIIEQTKLIKLEVTRIYDEEKYQRENLALDFAKASIHFSSQIDAIATDEVVGFEDEVEKIMEYLFADKMQLDVVSIVGMPGLGKTTLAKKMYVDPSIIKQFHVRAWCSISQTYRKREVLLTILGDVFKGNEMINTLNDEELATKVYQCLKGHRYLIVIDDIWDIKAWNDLSRSFPDDKMHSRILITSRLQKVASQTKAGSKVHSLRKFYDDESWTLFQKKLFQEDSFSEDLLAVGKQILHSCKGLPLAIVVTAGLLAKVEKSVHKWKQISECLSSHILNDSECQFKAIFELSYHHLPNHLKSCFLYFGAFEEGKEILVRNLKWLWMAEEFVQNTEAKSSEDVAEEYLMDLIGRSLVIATKERSCGGVKACRVHDLLHNFCSVKAKEESFLQAIHVDHWTNLLREYDQHRLSIYSEVFALIEAKPFSYSVRSLLHFATREDKFDKDVSFIYQNFKLLKVLDLACINIGKSFSEIGLLIHLRYLAVGALPHSIPPSIANLKNLQYFLAKAKRDFNGSVKLPDSIWGMVNLRHININQWVFFVENESKFESSRVLDNLEALSTPCFTHKEDAEKILRRLPKLRKLRFEYKDSRDVQFPVLDFLSQLVSLKVLFGRPLHRTKRYELNFPINLKRLTLSQFGLSWDDISRTGRTLPNLEVLKLIGNNWDVKWNVDDGDFPKLKYLKLSNLSNFSEWEASDDSFPILEQLVLEGCVVLDEIPACFEGIPTLRMITVKDCKFSVDDSARRIHREQKDEWQNEELKVYIYPRRQHYNFLLRRK